MVSLDKIFCKWTGVLVLALFDNNGVNSFFAELFIAQEPLNNRLTLLFS